MAPSSATAALRQQLAPTSQQIRNTFQQEIDSSSATTRTIYRTGYQLRFHRRPPTSRRPLQIQRSAGRRNYATPTVAKPHQARNSPRDHRQLSRPPHLRAAQATTRTQFLDVWLSPLASSDAARHSSQRSAHPAPDPHHPSHTKNTSKDEQNRSSPIQTEKGAHSPHPTRQMPETRSTATPHAADPSLYHRQGTHRGTARMESSSTRDTLPTTQKSTVMPLDLKKQLPTPQKPGSPREMQLSINAKEAMAVQALLQRHGPLLRNRLDGLSRGYKDLSSAHQDMQLLIQRDVTTTHSNSFPTTHIFSAGSHSRSERYSPIAAINSHTTNHGPHCPPPVAQPTVVQRHTAHGRLTRTTSSRTDHTATTTNTDDISTFLDMDWIDVIRFQENKNQIPPSAITETGISKSTIRVYAHAWKQLRQAIRTHPKLLSEIPQHFPFHEVLAQAAARAAHLFTPGTLRQIKHAISHVHRTYNPTPTEILHYSSKCATKKEIRAPRTDTVPNIHAFLNIVQQLYQQSTPKALRDRLVLLLLLLGTKRPSDIVRMFRHKRCLRFQITTIDGPQWITQYPSKAGPILHQLQYLSSQPSSTQIIIMNLRTYRPKTATAKRTIYSNWLPLHENRHHYDLCPVLAMARYLQETKQYRIKKSYKIDKNNSISCITDAHGLHPQPAKPILISLSGSTRTGLQPNTTSGIVRRRLLSPLKMDSGEDKQVPYIVRATSLSYKLAYGLHPQIAKRIGDWAADSTSFHRHYVRLTSTPVSKARLIGIDPHDYLLAHAHHLQALPLQPINNATSHTESDEKIAKVLAGKSTSRRRRVQQI
eukprot:CAMPEP_0167758854 /NCGR_PEP_ID=MMETSP0110_2-20121227/10702_1 /TAXON_ID=629695 /ORGANISM="Gymnochlora sp., Strain CCMP2014" /LENGTH=817 /DNA_ID=CAMNT_0007645181 /DNA_START=13 /DNA_END=2467 /DNA_ORIENTATION=-